MRPLRHEDHYHALSEADVLRRYADAEYCDCGCTPMDVWLETLAARERERRCEAQRSAAKRAQQTFPALRLLPSIENEPKPRSTLGRVFGIAKTGTGLSLLAFGVLHIEQAAKLLRGQRTPETVAYARRLRELAEELNE